MERAMTHATRQVLAINGGSSSIKFALFDKTRGLERRLHGIVLIAQAVDRLLQGGVREA
jgi:acetate kinase